MGNKYFNANEQIELKMLYCSALKLVQGVVSSEDIEKSTQILVDNFIGDTELCLSTLGFSGEELHQLRSEYGDTAFAFIGVYIK